MNASVYVNRPYLYNDELYHYGVLGMKWGVRRYQNKDGSLNAKGIQRDERLRTKSKQYSDMSYAYAKRAKEKAAIRINGSSSLERSDKYLKKSEKIARKMSDSGKNQMRTTSYQLAKQANIDAAKDYVKRSAASRVATAASTTAMSAAAAYIALNAGAPIAVVYTSTGPKYKLKKE